MTTEHAGPAGTGGEGEREPDPSDSLRTFGAVVQALRDQLDHLLDFARLRNMSVQIMPGGGHGHTSKQPLRAMSRLTRGSKFRRRSKR